MLMTALFYPIAFPIAQLLDCILGKEHRTYFRRAGTGVGSGSVACEEIHGRYFVILLSFSPPSELQELVKLHANKSDDNEEPLTYDEVLVVKVTPLCCTHHGITVVYGTNRSSFTRFSYCSLSFAAYVWPQAQLSHLLHGAQSHVSVI